MCLCFNLFTLAEFGIFFNSFQNDYQISSDSATYIQAINLDNFWKLGREKKIVCLRLHRQKKLGGEVGFFFFFSRKKNPINNQYLVKSGPVFNGIEASLLGWCFFYFV